VTIERGLEATLSRRVAPEDCADALGSGDLSVLATPRLLAWCEAATCAAVEGALTDEQTSVGTRVQLEHVGASAVGASVRVTATVVYVDGRLLRFEVAASADDGRLLATGQITRVAVDAERFLARVPAP
jgi:predicted thioesterase